MPERETKTCLGPEVLQDIIATLPHVLIVLGLLFKVFSEPFPQFLAIFGSKLVLFHVLRDKTEVNHGLIYLKFLNLIQNTFHQEQYLLFLLDFI